MGKNNSELIHIVESSTPLELQRELICKPTSSDEFKDYRNFFLYGTPMGYAFPVINPLKKKNL